MEFIPVKTRVLNPPKDDLFKVCDSLDMGLQERDIVLVTSKVVSIHEGRCVLVDGTTKESLIEEEADAVFQPEWRKKPITIIENAFISASGIDESNGGGYYVLLPRDSFASAQNIRAYLMKRFNLRELGVVITDSHSLPFRYGAISVSVGMWGFNPIESHVGKQDLFGRTIEYSKTNLPDALAAAATLVTGECNESQPITIARGVPNVTFGDQDPRPELFVPYEKDIYRDLYKDFKFKND